MNLRRGESIDSLPQQRLLANNKASDFALSSTGNLGKEENDDGNSIISEEDSAFEDQTPHHKAAEKKRASYMREREGSDVKDIQVERLGGKPQEMKHYKR